MRFVLRGLFVAVALCVVLEDQAESRGRRWRRSACANGSCGVRVSPEVETAVAATSKTPTAVLSGPQLVANRKASDMARMGFMGHLSGGYGGANVEGVGWGPTPASALNQCCFTGQRPVAAQCVVRGANGMWYACKLFW
ncbi:MAG: hypothetical protein CL480_11330 [Acidobacteria bacterium]|nr:hypothetical protein [Acidobacteriota bacterium]MBE41878.1 hypothetical protein [Acidobacteriota bacterium]